MLICNAINKKINELLFHGEFSIIDPVLPRQQQQRLSVV